MTALANHGIDDPECVTELNFCKEDIKNLKNNSFPINQEDIDSMKQQYIKLENNILLKQQQHDAKIVELTEDMNKLRINASPRGILLNTPSPAGISNHPRYVPSDRSSVQEISAPDNVTEVHKMLVFCYLNKRMRKMWELALFKGHVDKLLGGLEKQWIKRKAETTINDKSHSNMD
ncbi:hypothetical protein PPACK8108_LOCUS23085 [Phakopsora pachyrhizi]|uniref:Uncharacterized protein n=1 Tax=Phakopsora pachyrhizi TaxID=170000 RepID=A0AAV0BP86_PHAPC|nr:hypothetical protein PPACK8108_LOCUS23085 [Phakopsora pachyrhizi]